MIRERPPVPDIEAAAARVRPLFLEGDPVFHGKVTAAIGGLARGAPEMHQEAIKGLRKAWQQHEGSIRWSMGVAQGAPPEGGAMRSDRQIARDFIYGDLVHADPEARRRLRGIPVDDRPLAAAVWVADATRLTQATKQLIVDLTDASSLTARP